uniref:Uncharacterized protein n=1 Tax=Cucumis melo TaxID=3656 RepID=A0A9I9EBC7_CUCME
MIHTISSFQFLLLFSFSSHTILFLLRTVAVATTTVVPHAHPMLATTVVTLRFLRSSLCLQPPSVVLFFDHVRAQSSPPPLHVHICLTGSNLVCLWPDMLQERRLAVVRKKKKLIVVCSLIEQDISLNLKHLLELITSSLLVIELYRHIIVVASLKEEEGNHGIDEKGRGNALLLCEKKWMNILLSKKGLSLAGGASLCFTNCNVSSGRLCLTLILARVGGSFSLLAMNFNSKFQLKYMKKAERSLFYP